MGVESPVQISGCRFKASVNMVINTWNCYTDAQATLLQLIQDAIIVIDLTCNPSTKYNVTL